jgi:hypothetical protein
VLHSLDGGGGGGGGGGGDGDGLGLAWQRLLSFTAMKYENHPHVLIATFDA